MTPRKQSSGENTVIAVVRLRSSIGMRQEIRDTLDMLNLTRINHAVIIDKRPTYMGMLQKAKDAITWGELDAPTLARLLRKRGRLVGDKPLTEEYVAKHTKYKTIDKFAKAVIDSKASLADIPRLKKVFRLHPPSKGFRGSIKRPYKQDGELGYRGHAINDLIKRMT